MIVLLIVLLIIDLISDDTRDNVHDDTEIGVEVEAETAADPEIETEQKQNNRKKCNAHIVDSLSKDKLKSDIGRGDIGIVKQDSASVFACL